MWPRSNLTLRALLVMRNTDVAKKIKHKCSQPLSSSYSLPDVFFLALFSNQSLLGIFVNHELITRERIQEKEEETRTLKRKCENYGQEEKNLCRKGEEGQR